MGTVLSERIKGCRHFFKLDPDKELSDEQLLALYESGTDGLIVGGTLGITYDNVSQLLERLRRVRKELRESLADCEDNDVFREIKLIHEVSTIEAIVPGFDFYLVPLILNTQNPEWVLTAHHRAIKEFGDLIAWDKILVEGYLVLNKESAVAKLTAGETELSSADVVAYAQLADQLLKLPILYVEYSGVYGDVDLMRELKCMVRDSQIFYGGGIDTAKAAQKMIRYADTIIVGNVIYQDFANALATVPKRKLI
jgi:putative glycerol-1-phosphate prenyltransferase